MKKFGLSLAALALLPTFANAEIYWTDQSLSLLYGDNFEVDPAEQTTLTFETAGGWSYGDWFAFYDHVVFRDAQPNELETANYAEIGTRFSAGKIFGKDLSLGPITDVSLALQYETGDAAAETFLYGVGTDWKVPGFTFLSVNLYKRSNTDGDANEGWQLTPVWRMDFPVGNSNIVFDGFIDWVFSQDNDDEEHFHFNPQLKYDLGMAVMGKDKANKLFVGIEYDYWTNKYGIPDVVPFEVDQSALSFMVKYHF
ncbi:outer membrane protein OmpK [Ferrimonas aestuarii]|uniref:Ion channel protein Tsx n=1 Tax=Ferrimonas aestuarii TaxID=2569539 RepID=A0A4U1BU29_9GAMM|nr:outer membrane protein OmpK [Ferrimonas aestuarii]TKB58722.1 ion channel protein Tsx [Ferrimonas aestuarii]